MVTNSLAANLCRKIVLFGTVGFSFPAQAADLSRYLCSTDKATGFEKKAGDWNKTDFDPYEFLVTVENSLRLKVQFKEDGHFVCRGQRLGTVSIDYGYHCDSPNTLFQFNPINQKYIYSHLGGYAVSGRGKSTPASIEIGYCRKL